MKKAQLYLLVSGILLGAAAASFAADKDSAKHERRVEKTVGYLNRDAGRLEDRKAVMSRIKSEFKVDDARIKSLRDQKLGYGEITAVLAVAEEMPGGISDDNVKKVMSLRQGPPRRDWGELTRAVKADPHRVADSIKEIEDIAHSQEKVEVEKREHMEEMEMEGVETETEIEKDHSAAHERSEIEGIEKDDDRLERMERPEHIELPEKAELPEKPEKPEPMHN